MASWSSFAALLVCVCFGSIVAHAGGINLDLNGTDVTIPGTTPAAASPASTPIATPGLDDNTISSVTNNGAQPATLTTGDGNSANFSGTVTDGSKATALTLVGGGTLTLSGANTYTGPTTISAGTLSLSNAGSISNSSSIAIATGATFDISNVKSALSSTDIPSGLTGTTINSLQDGSSGTISLGTNTLFISNQTAANATFGGTITGTAQTFGGNCNHDCLPAQGVSLGVSGGGTLTLTGVNAYTGYTGIFGGTLALAGIGDISTSGGVALRNGSAFDISGLSAAGTTVAALEDGGNGGGGTVSLGGKTLTVGTGSGPNANQDSKFSGVISGTGGLTTAGTGTLTLSNTNSYTGATTVNSGTLALQTQCGNCDGGNQTNPTIVSTGDISASSGVTIGKSGTFDVSQLFTNQNNSFAPANAVVAAINDGANGGGNVYLGSNTLTIGIPGLAANANQDSQFSGVISDCGGGNSCGAAANCSGNCTYNGSLIKDGTGALTLSGANAYSGGTTINAGKLQLGNGGTSGSIVGDVTDNGTFAIKRSDTYTFGGVISGSGGFQQNGSGTTVLTATNTYSGPTTISAGTLALSGSGSTASSGVIDNGTFDISKGGGNVSIQSLTGTNGQVNLGAKTLTVTAASGTYSGTLGNFGDGGGFTVGSGTQTLNNVVEHYSGATTINSGANLTLSGSTVLATSSVVIDNGTFDISGNGNQHTTSTQINSLSGTNANAVVLLGNQTLVLKGSNISGTFAGSIGASGDTGGLAMFGAGNETLSGSSNYTGATSVDTGTLTVTGTLNSSSLVTVNNSGVLAGTGSVGSVDVTAAGELLPGTTSNPTGSLGINGNLTLSGSDYLVRVDGASASAVNITGSATLGGTLGINAIGNGFISGDQYTILTANKVSGTFANIQLGAFGTYVPFLTYNTNDVVLEISTGTIWSGANSSNWNDASNWQGGTTPSATIAAIFGNFAQTAAVTIDKPNTTVGEMEINGGVGQTYTFTINSGNSLTLSGNGIIDYFHSPQFNVGGSGSGTLQFQNTATAADSIISNSSGGTTQFGTSGGSDTATAGTASITNNNGGSTQFYANTTAGAASIVNNAGGTTTFNDFSTAGSSSITTNSGGLTQFVGRSTGGNASFVTNDTGVVDFSGSTGVNNDHNINAGSIAGSGSYFLGANALTVGGNNTSTAVSGTISDCGEGTQCSASGATGGSLIKIGTGTLTLSGNNTYTGGTTVTAGGTVAVTLGSDGSNHSSVGSGTVTLDNGTFQNATKSVLGTASSLTFANNFNLSGGGGTLDTTGGDLKLNGVIANAGPNAGNLFIIGGGTVTLTNSANSYSGSTVVAQSTFAVTNSGAAGTGFVGLVDGTFKNAAANGSSALSFGQTFYLGTISSAGATIDLNGNSGGNVTISGLVADAPGGVKFQNTPVTAGSLTVTGGNTLTLTNANTYSGGTTVTGGSTVAVTQGSADPTTASASSVGTGTVTLNNGTFQNAAGNGTTSTALSFANAFSLTGNGTIDTNGLTGGNITLNGAVTGTGGLTITGVGTVTLNSNGNTYGGATTVGDGNKASILAAGVASAFSANSAVTVSASSTLDLGSQSQTIAGLSGSGTVTNLTNPQNAQPGNVAVLTVNNGGTFDGTITDGNVNGVTTGLNVASGTLTLTSANTYSGSTTIGNGATLSLVHSFLDIDGAGSGQITIAKGTLELAPKNPFFPNQISGGLSNAINIDGTATIEATSGKIAVLTGNFTSSGNIQQLTFGSQTDTGTVALSSSLVTVAGLGKLEVAGGTLQAGNSTALGDLTSLATTTQIDSGATLDFNGYSSSIANLKGSGTLTNSPGMIKPVTITIVDGNFAGTIAGSVNITVGDAVTLSGNNTYSGTTTVSQGATLTGGAANSFSSKSAVMDSGTLDLGGFDQAIGSLAGQGIVTNGGNVNATLTIGAANTDTTFGGIIQDGTATTALNKAGLGTLVLSGVNTYSGGTTVSSGTLAVSQDANLGKTGSTLSFNGGTLQYLVAFDTARAVTLNAGGGTIDTNSFNTTLSGTIDGAGALTKIGAGTLTLSGTNTYQGGTNINAGTIAASKDANLGQSNGALNLNGGTLQYLASFNSNRAVTLNGLGGTIDTSTFNIKQSGNFSGGGGLIKAGAGTLTLTGSNTYGGSTTINGGTFAAGAANAFSAASVVTINSGTLDLGGYKQTIGGLGGASTAVVTNGGSAAATLTTGSGNFAGVIKDGGATNTTALTKIDTGTLFLSGANTYAGGTTINAGTLMLGNGGTITGNVVDNGAFTINRSDTYTFAGVISGSGAFQQFGGQFGTGTTVLTGTNTYSGGTNIIGGTLAVSKDANLGQSGGALTFNGGALQYLAGFNDTARPVTLYAFGGTFDTNSFSSTLSGNFSGSGNLTKIGMGTLTLTGTETYTGVTNINGGTLQLDGTGSITSANMYVGAGAIFSGIGNVTVPLLNVVGTLAPGSASKPTGTLNITGNLAFASAAVYVAMINGSSSSATTVSGTATLTGATLKIAATQIKAGTAYTLLTANGTGGLNGTKFVSTQATVTAAGFIYNETVSYTANSVQATFSNPQPNAPSGSVNSGGQLSVADMQTSFATTLLNPNVSGRGGTPGGGYGPALGFAPETPLTPEEQAAYNAVTPHEPLDAMMRSLNTGYSHSVWASAYGGYSHISGDSASGNSTATTGGGGIASGIDFRIGADTVLGFALGGGSTSWSLSANQGSGTSEIFQAGVYGSHRFGDAYISGSLAYAFDHMSTKRNVTAPTANLTSSFNANGVTGRVETGYRFGQLDVGITPYIAGEFSALHTPSYSESTASGTAGLALSYASQTQTNERAEVGIWADKLYVGQDNAIVRLGAKAGYAHDWWSSTSFNAQFASLPTQSFTMTGITPPSNLGLASLLAEVRYRNGVSLSAKFDAELGQNAYSLAGTGTFRYAW